MHSLATSDFASGLDIDSIHAYSTKFSSVVAPMSKLTRARGEQKLILHL